MTNKHPHRARGTHANPDNRYHRQHTSPVDDDWPGDGQPRSDPRTRVQSERCRKLISYNQSPDIPFDRSINPYRGCEHGCIYCYARPSHAWLDLSPGLDFETRLFSKRNAPETLLAELAKPGYHPAPIALGVNTDAYQPIEKTQRVTRRILEILRAHRHPVSIISKSALIERDLDVLAEMAEARLLDCAISLTTLDKSLSQRMEPRAAAPARRLKTITRLRRAGIPVTVMVAPVIPMLTDSELETLLATARDAGADSARYVLLRLPREVGGLFDDWLRRHYPDKATRVMNRIRDCHAGRAQDSRFGQRMTGSGVFAQLIAKRFSLAHDRLGFAEPPALRGDLFIPPQPNAPLCQDTAQLSLPGF